MVDDEEQGYPEHWEADVVLRDGSVAQIRPIRPSDADALREFHDSQSPESIYLRFFAPLKHLSDKDVHRFTHVDHQNRVALVLRSGGRLVAVGRFDRFDDGRKAEVAFNVADSFQGRGVGSVLLEHLAAIGLELGVEEFVADVLPQNMKMLSVFTDAGYAVQRAFEDGVVALSFPIEPTSASREVVAAREQRADATSLRTLLTPASLAVVGVSERPDRLGRRVWEQVVSGGYAGAVYAVNSTVHHSIPGVVIHERVTDLPEPVDLVVVAVPAERVPQVVDDCATRGVRSVVVLSEGFAESGPAGVALQHELLRRARRGGMRVLGPNSFGLINTAAGLNVSLAARMPAAGRLGLFSQSGALGVAVLDFAGERGLGLSQFVSAGNRVDVSGNDLMQWWIDDEDTTVVGLYLESVGNPRKFSRVARRLSALKPVIVIKPGTSTYGVPPGHRVRGTEAAPPAFQAMLDQAGVIRAEDLHQLFDVAQLLLHQPPPRGRRVAIVGNSDALGTIAADTAVSHGLQVTHGPVNLPAEAGIEQLRDALRDAFADDRVDAVLTNFLRQRQGDGQQVAAMLAEVSSFSEKPCTTTILGARGVSEALAAGSLPGGGRRVVPAYPLPEDAVRALAHAARRSDWLAAERGDPVLPPDIDHDAAAAVVEAVLQDAPAGRALTQEELITLLAAYGITLWPIRPAASPEEAERAAKDLGYPVVVKSVSPRVRSQPVTAVRLDLRHSVAVREAWQALEDALSPTGDAQLVVQRMATPGTACVIESGEDPLFGPVVRFGLGGAPIEVMGDVGYRIPPLTSDDVSELIDSVRAAPLLLGRGGRGAADRAALEDLVARVAVLAEQLPQVASLTLNPVNAHPGGVDVLDAQCTVAPAASRQDTGRRVLPAG